MDDFDGVSGDYWVMFESDMSWITPRYDEYNVTQKEGTAELRMYFRRDTLIKKRFGRKNGTQRSRIVRAIFMCVNWMRKTSLLRAAK